jgi:uncharacterized membrane protein
VSDVSESRKHSRTAPSENGSPLNYVLAQNIEALRAKQSEEAAQAGLQERLAEAITAFSGSMRFVYVHLAVVGFWIVVNLGMVAGIPVFDPTFVILATVASVEAIFLSTFVLISQNRAAKAADTRAKLDLQTSLLAEHEITRLLTLTVAIAEHLGVTAAEDPMLEELKRDISPEKVLDEIERKSDDA